MEKGEIRAISDLIQVTTVYSVHLLLKLSVLCLLEYLTKRAYIIFLTGGKTSKLQVINKN